QRSPGQGAGRTGQNGGIWTVLIGGMERAAVKDAEHSLEKPVTPRSSPLAAAAAPPSLLPPPWPALPQPVATAARTHGSPGPHVRTDHPDIPPRPRAAC